MRPGEIIALRWNDIDAGMARVDDRYYKGRQGTTKNRKARMVALSESVQRDLANWRPFAIRADGFRIRVRSRDCEGFRRQPQARSWSGNGGNTRTQHPIKNGKQFGNWRPS
jgi:integrase